MENLFEKESLLNQIHLIEENLRRVKVLIETDMHRTPNTNVPVYCLLKIEEQSKNLIKELRTVPENKKLKCQDQKISTLKK